MKLNKLVAVTFTALLIALPVSAQEEAPRKVVFFNVNIFDGVNEERIENGSVLVEGNLIKVFARDRCSGFRYCGLLD